MSSIITELFPVARRESKIRTKSAVLNLIAPNTKGVYRSYAITQDTNEPHASRSRYSLNLNKLARLVRDVLDLKKRGFSGEEIVFEITHTETTASSEDLKVI